MMGDVVRNYLDSKKQGEFMLRSMEMQYVFVFLCLAVTIFWICIWPVGFYMKTLTSFTNLLAAVLCSTALFRSVAKKKGLSLFLPFAAIVVMDLLWFYPYSSDKRTPAMAVISVAITVFMVVLLLLFILKEVNTTLFVVIGIIIKDIVLYHLIVDEHYSEFIVGGILNTFFLLKLVLPISFKILVSLTVLNIKTEMADDSITQSETECLTGQK